MSTRYSEFKEPHIVWYAISTFLQDIKTKLEILSTYGTYSEKLSPDLTTKSFFDTSMRSLYESVVMDFAKLLDKDSMFSNENCCMRQLKALCISGDNFSPSEKDQLVLKFELIGVEYKELIQRINILRDKRLAHSDLRDIFVHNTHYPLVGELMGLYLSILNILSEISEKTFGFPLMSEDFSNSEEKYASIFCPHLNSSES